MTDATLTPEIYGDFGLFMEQASTRRRQLTLTKTEPLLPADQGSITTEQTTDNTEAPAND